MPAALPFWDAFPDGYEEVEGRRTVWDRVILADKVLPGIGSVKGAASHRVEVQKVNGVDGGALIERGYNPSELDIDLLLWTPAQWAEFQKQMPRFYRKPNRLDLNDQPPRPPRGATKAEVAAFEEEAAAAQQKKAFLEMEAVRKSAVALQHPAAALLGIYSVIVTSVALPADGPVTGSKVITIRCTEYVAPKSQVTMDDLALVDEGVRNLFPRGRMALRKITGTKPPPDVQAGFGIPARNQGHKPSRTDGGPSGTLSPAQGGT